MPGKESRMQVVTLDAARYLVSASVNSHGLGVNREDTAILFPYFLGRLKARALLARVLAVGAEPSVLGVTIFSESEENTQEVLRGIRDEASTVLPGELPLMLNDASREKSPATILVMTASGVVFKDRIKISSTRPGDHVYLLGTPRDIGEIRDLDGPELCRLRSVRELASSALIHEVRVVDGQSLREILADLGELTQTPCRVLPVEEDLLDREGVGASGVVFSSRVPVRSRTLDGVRILEIGRMGS